MGRARTKGAGGGWAGEGGDDGGGGRIFLEDPTPINPRRDNISRKNNPSLRCTYFEGGYGACIKYLIKRVTVPCNKNLSTRYSSKI